MVDWSGHAGQPTTCRYRERQPDLLLGAVRSLGGSVDSYAAFRAFLLDRDGVPLAYADPHGASLDWFGRAAAGT